MSAENDRYNGNNRNFKNKNYRKNWSSSGNQHNNNHRFHNSGSKKNFQRPGPFGFKPRYVSGREEAMANPFGFASHNGLAEEGSADESEQEEETAAVLTLPEEDDKGE